MSYETVETSRDSGAPVEMFKFVVGGQSFLYTSSDVAQSASGESYTPEPIHRSRVELDGESLKGAIEITLTRTNPVGAFFIGYLPEPTMTLLVISRHRSDAGEVRSTWEVSSARFKGSEVVLTCIPSDAYFHRQVPRNGFDGPCVWATYTGQCGLNRDLFKVIATVTVVSGDTIQGSAFSSKPDGWFTGGYVERATGERRWVIAHVGATLTLASPFLGLAVNEVVSGFAGDDHTEATCATKFSNLDNHLGWARIPTRNPFDKGLGVVLGGHNPFGGLPIGGG